ncbi:adenine methyltransferase, partial [Paenibacillus macerans]
MSINKGLFTSTTDLWETPQDFFDVLHSEFNFETDVCALPENAKCETYYSPDDNGLNQEWRGTCWMN